MFPDRLPSVREIDRARPSLRQAYEIATMIEGMEGYAPEPTIDRHRQQLLFQIEQTVARLGFEMKRPGPALVIDNVVEVGPR